MYFSTKVWSSKTSSSWSRGHQHGCWGFLEKSGGMQWNVIWMLTDPTARISHEDSLQVSMNMSSAMSLPSHVLITDSYSRSLWWCCPDGPKKKRVPPLLLVNSSPSVTLLFGCSNEVKLWDTSFCHFEGLPTHSTHRCTSFMPSNLNWTASAAEIFHIKADRDKVRD